MSKETEIVEQIRREAGQRGTWQEMYCTLNRIRMLAEELAGELVRPIT